MRPSCTDRNIIDNKEEIKMERYLVIVCLGEVFIDTPERGHGFGDWEFLVYADSPEHVANSTAYAIAKTIADCFDERFKEYHFWC